MGGRMTELSFLGLGLMGSSLARALVRRGVDVTVWNRSPAKAQALVGARVAPDLAAALAASPVIVICIDNHAATRALLEGHLAALAGRVVVQLSTGTPREAVQMADWLGQHGVRCLDGAILCGPDAIDGDGGEILLCGDADGHAQAGAMLAGLAAKVRYLGPNFAAASALDLAWLNIWYGNFVSVAHSAAMCRAEGVNLAEFAALFPDNPEVRGQANLIREGRFHEPTATLEVWGNALARVQQQARDAGISPAIPDFYASYFKKAVAAGLGQQEAIAIVKVL
jgi:3-hydroxyisobutyrate dehydrogenase-like beta-hydroxyacid dehydrogenase